MQNVGKRTHKSYIFVEKYEVTPLGMPCISQMRFH